MKHTAPTLHTSLIFLGLLVSILPSCNYKVDKKPMGDAIRVTDELRQTVSFIQVKNEVFQSKCIACHGNSGGVNLESYSSAYQNLAGIKRTVFKSKTMPKSPYSPLNKREAEVLTAWIEAGGPDRPLGGGDGGAEPEPTPIEPTYASINKKVFEIKCISCHQAGESAGRIPMVTKEDILDSPYDLVVPGDPDESGIMIVVQLGARKFMPPTDSGITPLTEEEKKCYQDLDTKWRSLGQLDLRWHYY